MKKIAIKSDYTILVKFAGAQDDFQCKNGDDIIVEDANGQHLVKVIMNSIPDARECAFQVVRIANANDLKNQDKNKGKAEHAKKLCNKYIEKFGLAMRLKKVYINCDGAKILFYFTADRRVDFRELVKSLATDFARTRIEMRQITEREEVAMMGGVGACGRPCCCSQFLDDFGQVSIKMAKNQGIALNPNKVNGYCGKLLCCLAYENNDYIEVLKVMPKVGESVNLPNGGSGVVYFNHLIKKIVRVETILEDEKIYQDFTLEELAQCNDSMPKGYEIFDYKCECEKCNNNANK